MPDKILIGKTDKADFIDWDLKEIPIKIDTGAYRCSIDSCYAKVFKINKVRTLKYTLLNEDHPAYNGKVYQTSEFKTSKVKSSNGSKEERYIVKSNIQLFGINFLAEFSLSTRTDMKFPILIGRKLLNNKFIVDTSKVNLSHKLKKKKKTTKE